MHWQGEPNKCCAECKGPHFDDGACLGCRVGDGASHNCGLVYLPESEYDACDPTYFGSGSTCGKRVEYFAGRRLP